MKKNNFSFEKSHLRDEVQERIINNCLKAAHSAEEKSNIVPRRRMVYICLALIALIALLVAVPLSTSKPNGNISPVLPPESTSDITATRADASATQSIINYDTQSSASLTPALVTEITDTQPSPPITGTTLWSTDMKTSSAVAVSSTSENGITQTAKVNHKTTARNNETTLTQPIDTLPSGYNQATETQVIESQISSTFPSPTECAPTECEPTETEAHGTEIPQGGDDDPPEMIILSSGQIEEFAKIGAEDDQKLKDYITKNASGFFSLSDEQIQRFIDKMKNTDIPRINGKLPEYLNYYVIEHDWMIVTYKIDGNDIWYGIDYIFGDNIGKDYSTFKPVVYSDKIALVSNITFSGQTTSAGEYVKASCRAEIGNTLAFCQYINKIDGASADGLETILKCDQVYPLI
ncbi:MAG: hypothetical protein IJS94_04645 [Clostridia bacterium]|nr:hypothetical protein [Clostridia bacterium]